MPLGMEVGLGPGDFVLDGDRDLVLDGDSASPPQKGGGTPKFSAHIYCGQTAGYVKTALGMEVGLSPGDFVLDGDAAPLHKRGRSPQFSAYVYCGQTAAWIKMPLGTELGLGSDDIVRWGPSSPPQKGGGAPSPIFGPCLLWPNGWMDQDGTWHGGGPWSRPYCARWEPSSPPKNGDRAPVIFGPLLLWPNGWMH